MKLTFEDGPVGGVLALAHLSMRMANSFVPSQLVANPSQPTNSFSPSRVSWRINEPGPEGSFCLLQ